MPKPYRQEENEMNCILKKFILKQLNKLLDNYKDDVESSKAKVKLWLDRT